jgi:rubrerythrin
MDDSTKKLIIGLRQAMQAERTGQVFYRNAALNTADPNGKETFDQLAREEEEHFQFLATHYRALMETGKPAQRVSLQGHAEVEPASPIFSEQFKTRIKDAHFEMSALAIAVTLELSAINHYREQASKALLPEVRQFFEDLANWESAHYQLLLNQQQALQNDYWTASGFSPF